MSHQDWSSHSLVIKIWWHYLNTKLSHILSLSLVCLCVCIALIQILNRITLHQTVLIYIYSVNKYVYKDDMTMQVKPGIFDHIDSHQLFVITVVITKGY